MFGAAGSGDGRDPRGGGRSHFQPPADEVDTAGSSSDDEFSLTVTVAPKR